MNRLGSETSPYLLQHAGNPVDWFPWGQEALTKARLEDKPIFLSIGYSACHWCHVMEHETFEDVRVAGFLNQHFISIKVDREERPDLDSIYMSAVTAMTGQGGWPMTVFLTPDLKPFFGGTYFPPIPRYGLPSFGQLITSIHKAWVDNRGDLENTAEQIKTHIKSSANWNAEDSQEISEQNIVEVVLNLKNQYDWAFGGWGRAPKFPQPMTINFLIAQARAGSTEAHQMVIHSLDAMQLGGFHDLVGGGFHRYSTDANWLVPHFEKMLYDNAQLALAYLHAYLLTGRVDYKNTCTRTLDFIQREMSHPLGGLYSSIDADSENQEGKFYTWDISELKTAISDPEEWALFSEMVELPFDGHFEGKIILRRQKPDPLTLDGSEIQGDSKSVAFEILLNRLKKIRDGRTRPQTDDKVIVFWNSLAITAFCEAGRYLNRPDYLEFAIKNAQFVLKNLVIDGKLYRSWRNGAVNNFASLEDVAAFTYALLSLYQANPAGPWYEHALNFLDEMIENYQDPEGGFFDTHAQQTDILFRPKEKFDNATPCGNSIAANCLLWFHELEDRPDLLEFSRNMVNSIRSEAISYPSSFGNWLQAMARLTRPTRQLAIILPETEDITTSPITKHFTSTYYPNLTLAVTFASTNLTQIPAILQGKSLLNGQPGIYLCENIICQAPTSDLARVIELLERT